MALTPVSRARLQATLACAGACMLLAWRGGRGPGIAAVITTVLALLAWFFPAGYVPVQRALDQTLHLILTALTWLLLGLLYLLVFTPLRLWRTLTSRDPLQQRLDPKATTYLQPMPPAAARRFDRQF